MRARFALDGLKAWYGDHLTINDLSIEFAANKATALIGPSGSGKSTVVRCINRMHEEIPGARAEGKVTLDDTDLYGSAVDVVAVRRAIGMVFQKPNPFPTMSIFDNVAAGLRLTAAQGRRRDKIEEALRGAGLWEEVKDRLNKPGFGLSGGQQQRLCIARALAVEPEVLLMDEPASALDPIATLKIEELIAGAQVARTRSSSSPTTCSRPRAWPTPPRSCSTASSSRSGRPRRSSPSPTTSVRSITSPASSGSAMIGFGPRALSAGAPISSSTQALGGLDLVVTTLDRTLEALENQDIELAAIVVNDDDRIDGRYLEVQQGILSLLALQAPVASRPAHGRRPAARDQARRAHGRPVREHRQDAPGGRLRAAVGRADAAARSSDGRLARSRSSRPSRPSCCATSRSPRTSCARTSRSTGSTATSSARAVEIGTDADRREWAMSMMLVARAIERIGDNAVDIGEQVAFVVTGLFREFSDASHVTR